MTSINSNDSVMPRIGVERLITPDKPRTRRDATFPSRNFRFELKADAWRGRKREVSGVYELAWGWTRWESLAEGDFDDEDNPVRHRWMYGSINHTLSETPVGAVELQEIDCHPWISRREFFEAMDDYSAVSAELANVICGTLSERAFELAAEGTFLFWNSAWMHPDHARGAVWAELTNNVIDRMRNWSMLIVKAFPLEYQDGGSRKGFEQRQEAMIRYYKRIIGVEPIKRKRSRTYGYPENGWMLCWNPRVVATDAKTEEVIYPVRYGLD